MEHSHEYFLAFLIGYGSIGFVFGLANIFSANPEKRKPIFEIFISLIMASVLGAMAFVTYINLKESETIVRSNQDMSMKIRRLADETENMAIETQHMVQKTQHMAQKTRDMAEQTQKMVESAQQAIHKTQQIAEETKKIADISLHQFAIQSYPTFSIKIEDPYVENGMQYQSIQARNEGEITAFHVSFLHIDVFQQEKGNLHFQHAKDSRYKYIMKKQAGTGDITAQLADINPLLHEIRLSQDTSVVLSKTSDNTGKWDLDNLRYAILLARFKVPYDNKYRYDAFAYYLQKEKNLSSQKDETEWTYAWKVLDTEKTNSLLKRYKKIASDKKVKMFLSDYHRN